MVSRSSSPAFFFSGDLAPAFFSLAQGVQGGIPFSVTSGGEWVSCGLASWMEGETGTDGEEGGWRFPRFFPSPPPPTLCRCIFWLPLPRGSIGYSVPCSGVEERPERRWSFSEVPLAPFHPPPRTSTFLSTSLHPEDRPRSEACHGDRGPHRTGPDPTRPDPTEKRRKRDEGSGNSTRFPFRRSLPPSLPPSLPRG